MCFTNLPIDFDGDGHAQLDRGGDFGVTAVASAVAVAPPRSGGHRTTELNIEPVTRVAGALAFHTTVDLDEGVVTEAHSEAVQFRGYELILQGRSPVEAIDISSRACGVCGGVHATCAAMTLEMVFGVAPPPLAIVARNVAEAAELFYDHCLHLFLLAGPDYSEAMVRFTNPSLWKRAERISSQMSSPFEVQGQQVFLTLSLGIAASGDGEAPEELLRDADAAMYFAKAAGRARHAIFDKSVRRQAVKRLELEQALRRAIARKELRLVYQPQVKLESGEIFGFEALLRWDDPRRGLVSPLEFIPLAEETGLIIPIGEWVLAQACRQARLWREAQPDRPLKVSVNISVRQLADPEFPHTVRRILDETGVQANDLWLEVTETALIEEEHRAIFGALANLERLGMRLAIDDFGIGFSSLNRFRQLPPVAAVKIDKLFIDGLRAHSADRAIVAAAIGLARALGATTVAEGVETSDQVASLRELSCDLAQGYHFSRPKAAWEFDALMGPGGRRTLAVA